MSDGQLGENDEKVSRARNATALAKNSCSSERACNRSTVVFVDLKSAINKFVQRNVGGDG
jgi:hypothetical protein